VRSIKFKLEQEHREIVNACLRKHGIRLGQEAEKVFACNMQASIVAFLDQKSASDRNVKYRQKHDALRAVWQLVWEDDVPIGQVRARLCSLPKQVTEFLHARARQVLAEMAGAAGSNFSGWVRDADAESLKKVIRLLSADGGKLVTRSRGPGKRSSPRLEPLIFGHARGALQGAREGGRPGHDAQDALVMYLAIDWSLVTGAKPPPGRSDHTGFGELVHSVFQWLEEPSPGQALRRYWQAVKVQRSRSAGRGLPSSR
jgi:hypothetical protein